MSESSREAFESRPRTTRVALDVLDRDQDRLLYEGDYNRSPRIEPLVDGFPTYWSALVWYQAAGIRTLGHVERVLEPSDIMPEAGIMDHLLISADSTGESAYARMRLVESLDDACEIAYRQFRDRAKENDEEHFASHSSVDENDIEDERNPLMRPSFYKLDRGQAGALESLWEGFDDRQQVGRWTRNLSAVVNGEKTPGLLNSIISSPPLLEDFLDRRSDAATMTRYRFAVDNLLPMFLAASRTLRGGERSKTETNSEWKQG